MTWGQGARMALPIYGYYMQKVYKDPVVALSTTDFKQPKSYDSNQFSCAGEPSLDVPAEEENPFGI
jgi:penicillin-binding protein 1A